MDLTEDKEQEIHDIISHLKFIGTWKKGEKIDISSLAVFPDNWATSAYRTYQHYLSDEESRVKAFEYAQKHINEAVNKCYALKLALGSKNNNGRSSPQNHSNPQERRVIRLLIKSIREARRGLMDNSKTKTYISDRMYQSQIQTFVDLLDAKLVDFTCN